MLHSRRTFKRSGRFCALSVRVVFKIHFERCVIIVFCAEMVAPADLLEIALSLEGEAREEEKTQTRSPSSSGARLYSRGYGCREQSAYGFRASRPPGNSSQHSQRDQYEPGGAA